MSCKLCHGSKVVQQPLGSYGFTFGPCPNCTIEKFISQYPVLYGVCRSVDDTLKIVSEKND